jgi:hypothetical protein
VDDKNGYSRKNGKSFYSLLALTKLNADSPENLYGMGERFEFGDWSKGNWICQKKRQKYENKWKNYRRKTKNGRNNPKSKRNIGTNIEARTFHVNFLNLENIILTILEM